MAAAIGLAGTPANADAGWNVSPEDPFTAVGADPEMINRSAITHCETVTASGGVFSSDSNHVGNITSSNWNRCEWWLGLACNIVQIGTWTVNANNPNASGGIDVEIRNVNATISGPFCDVTLTGTLCGTYDNTGTLTINEPEGGNLMVTSASCWGIFNSGDRPGLSVTLTMTPSIVVTPA